MEWLQDLIDKYTKIGEISLVHAILALSTFAALFGGLLSVASIPIAGVAGFGGAILINDVGLPVEVVLAIGGLIGGFTALLLSYPLLRLSSHWIALSTIALLLIFRVAVLNLDPITGGAIGVAIRRTVSIWHLLIVLAATMWFFSRMRRSRLGLATESVRADPDVASSLGVDALAIRRIAFVLSGVIGGVGGVLFANLLQFLSPETYYLNLAFLVLASVVLGGRFHWLGAVVGALVFTALPELMRAVLDQGENIGNGVLLIVIIIFLPGGLIEPGRRQQRHGARAALLEARTGVDEDETMVPDATGDKALQTSARPRREEPAEAIALGPVLEVRQLRKQFGGLLAINDLSFGVPNNSVFGVVGPNGAGKTTLLNVVTGLAPVDGGVTLVAGEDVTNLPTYERARRGLARTFQGVRLFEGLTVLENIIVGQHWQRSSHLWEAVLALPRERRERREAEERARELIDRVGLIGRPEQFAGTLSFANQRRAEIARALASNPRILLLDEPTAGMHKLGSRAVGELMIELQEQGLTIVVVEHNLELVLDYCERAVVMDFGQLLCEGEPARCLEQPEVREAYFGRKADAERIESLLKLRQH